MLILINILEFVVIINYCAALHVVWTSPVTDNPHPIILNVIDTSDQRSGECSLVSTVHCWLT
jgi:hypothetical protein